MDGWWQSKQHEPNEWMNKQTNKQMQTQWKASNVTHDWMVGVAVFAVDAKSKMLNAWIFIHLFEYWNGAKKKSRAMHSAHTHTQAQAHIGSKYSLLLRWISNKMESNRYTLWISWCSYAIWENYQVCVHNKVTLHRSPSIHAKSKY